jgi:hypothetical protein
MKKYHTRINLLFILANCTSIYQPADVIFQCPFKHAFWQEFNLYTTNIIFSQIEAKKEVKVDFKLSTLKPKLCSWLYSIWQHLTNKPEMVIKGWNKTGLFRSFDLNFQTQAMVDNMKAPLLKSIEENLEIKTSNHGEVEKNAEVL